MVRLDAVTSEAVLKAEAPQRPNDWSPPRAKWQDASRTAACLRPSARPQVNFTFFVNGTSNVKRYGAPMATSAALTRPAFCPFFGQSSAFLRGMSKAAAFNAVEPKPTEVSVIGQLQGATGLAASSAHCTWRITHGKTWTLERGEGSGSSHTATTNENGAIVWSHPIDAVLVGTDTGWPRLELEVRSRDEFDRSDLAGYAVVHVPATPGVHELHCPIWKPKGTLGDRIAAAFIGGGASLKDSAVVFGTLAENGKGLERGGFATVGAGQIHLQLTVCSRRVEPRRLPPKIGEGDEDDD